jgi:WD40 repeat protein
MKPHVTCCAALLAASLTVPEARADEEAQRKPVRELADDGAKFNEVVISPDSKTLAASAQDGRVRIWDIKSGKLLHRLDERPRKVTKYGLRFSLDGKELEAFSWRMKADLSATMDEQISSWDIATGKRLRTQKTKKDGLLSRALSPDGKRVAISTPISCEIREGVTFKLLSTLKFPNGAVSVAFSKDGSKLFAASPDNVITRWDVATGKDEIWRKASPDIKDIVSVLLTPDGKRLAVTHFWGTTFFDVETKAMIVHLKEASAPDAPMAFARGGDWLLVPQWKVVVAYDTRTGKKAAYTRGLNLWKLDSAAISTDGKWIATTASKEECVKLWDLSAW